MLRVSWESQRGSSSETSPGEGQTATETGLLGELCTCQHQGLLDVKVCWRPCPLIHAEGQRCGLQPELHSTEAEEASGSSSQYVAPRDGMPRTGGGRDKEDKSSCLAPGARSTGERLNVLMVV